MTVREFFKNFNGSDDVRIILHEVGICREFDTRANLFKYDDECFKDTPWIVEWINAEVCDWTVEGMRLNLNVTKKLKEA